MDPQKNAGGDFVIAPNAGYTLIAMAFLIKSASWMVGMVSDGAAEADGSMPITQAMVDLINGPLIDIVCVLMVIGGFFLAVFAGGGSDRTRMTAGETKIARTLPLQMSELAQSAEGRLNSLIAQFRSIRGPVREWPKSYAKGPPLACHAAPSSDRLGRIDRVTG